MMEGRWYFECLYKDRIRIRDRKSREDIFFLIILTFSQ